jgi:hypothetical protein
VRNVGIAPAAKSCENEIMFTRRIPSRVVLLPLLSILAITRALAADSPQFSAELIFPLHPKHNHASSIVECPNGDLLVSWYRGSGERQADDVAVYGARRRSGQTNWSEPFRDGDTPGFPDGNTAMFIDARKRLWLFWPIVLANTWQSCITSYRVATRYETDGTPKWDWQGQVLLKPKVSPMIWRRLLRRDQKLRRSRRDDRSSSPNSAKRSRTSFPSASAGNRAASPRCSVPGASCCRSTRTLTACRSWR